MCGFIAQLVEHRTGIAEVTGSNPVEALIFFRLLLSNCSNWKINCDDHSSLHLLPQFKYMNYYSGFRRKARVIKCNRFPRQKGGHGPRRSMRRLRKLGTRNTTLLACGRKFWQVSRHKRSSRIQRCRSFSERVGPRIIFFKASQVSSCSKRSRGVTTEPIACGFCCYFRS